MPFFFERLTTQAVGAVRILGSLKRRCSIGFMLSMQRDAAAMSQQARGSKICELEQGSNFQPKTSMEPAPLTEAEQAARKFLVALVCRMKCVDRSVNCLAPVRFQSVMSKQALIGSCPTVSIFGPRRQRVRRGQS